MTWFKIEWFEFFLSEAKFSSFLGELLWMPFVVSGIENAFLPLLWTLPLLLPTSVSSLDGFHSLFLNLPFWLEKIIFLEVLSFEPPDISRSLLVWLWNFRNGISFEPAWIVRFFDSSHLFEIRLQMWLYSFVPRITQHQQTLEIWMVRDDEWNLTQKSIM